MSKWVYCTNCSCHQDHDFVEDYGDETVWKCRSCSSYSRWRTEKASEEDRKTPHPDKGKGWWWTWG